MRLLGAGRMANLRISNEAAVEAVDSIAAALLPGPEDALRSLFARNGSRPPTVTWSPGPHDLRHPFLTRFADLCADMQGSTPHLTEDRFVFHKFGGLCEWMMVVRPEDKIFRYQYYGRGISEHYGRDLTGETTATIGGHIQTFFEAVYRACTERVEPVLTEHEPPSSVFVRLWRRLIVPVMRDDDSGLAFFAVINLPENDLRAGLDLISDPVFVLDAKRVVYYANVAARKAYALTPLRAPGPTILQLTGLDIGPMPPPSEIMSDTRLSDRVELSLIAGIVERKRISVSAAEHRGQLFYVVVVSPVDV